MTLAELEKRLQALGPECRLQVAFSGSIGGDAVVATITVGMWRCSRQCMLSFPDAMEVAIGAALRATEWVDHG